MVYAGGQALSFYRPWLLPTRMCHPPKPAFVTPCAILWCMQGVNTCHFIDPGFCQPACVAPITRICHPLCHFMVYARGQALSFYRPWLLLTRICHPQKPACVTPLCYFIGHAGSQTLAFARAGMHLKQSMWLVWLHSSFKFIWNQQGIHVGSCKKKPEAPRKQSKPEEKLKSSIMPAGKHLQWPQQWPCFMVYAGGQALSFYRPWLCQPACVAPITRICHPLCHFMVYAGGQHLSFYRPWLLLTRICHPQNPHVSPPVLFYRSCRESDPSFCQSRHAFEAIHVACLVAQFI